MAITYKHSVNSGDLVAAMASIRSYWLSTAQKGHVFQRINAKSNYYAGAIHPITDENGEMVCMNKKQFSMLHPLIEKQPYIDSFKIWEGEKVIVDFDKIRGECYVGMPYFAIQNWIPTCFTDMQPNLSDAWIEVNYMDTKKVALVKRDIIINRTERYNNDLITYYFLKKYEDRVVFSGTKGEYEKFKEQWKLDIRYLQVKDFYELACNIKAAGFMIGNQSMCWNLAEAMKTPRILELCSFAPNCIHGIGENSYGFLHQSALEYYVDKLAQMF